MPFDENGNVYEPISNKPHFVLTPKDAKILWNWIQFQHLPYDKFDLKILVSRLGDFCYQVKDEK